jgi:hypothetical protein
VVGCLIGELGELRWVVNVASDLDEYIVCHVVGRREYTDQSLASIEKLLGRQMRRGKRERGDEPGGGLTALSPE